MRTSFVRGPSRRTYRFVTWWGAASIIGAAVSASLPNTAVGQTPSAADQEQRIKQLEDTVNQLKKDTRQVEVNQGNQANQKPWVGWNTDTGFFLSSQDGNNKLRIGGYTQLDARFFASNKDGLNTDQFL